jgi:hypothetical protein
LATGHPESQPRQIVQTPMSDKTYPLPLYPDSHYLYRAACGYSRRKIGFNIDDLWDLKKEKYFPGRRRIMSRTTQCKHKPIPAIERKLYPDYDNGSYLREYIELKEEALE